MPPEASAHEAKMHGCFSEDAATGIVYTGIPGAGLFAISPDLKMWSKLGSDKRLEANIHGLVVFEHRGERLIAAAQNESERVLILGLDGAVKQELRRPEGGEFSTGFFTPANDYYAQHRASSAPKLFSATDVTYLPEAETLYVVTGYCLGDFVLAARQGADGKWAWGPTAWGGKGDGPGQFKTAHGVFAFGGEVLVANRERHEVCRFSPQGVLLGTLPGIPAGSRVCNVSRAEADGFFVVNALAPVTQQQVSAPIYAYRDDAVISTLVPGDLGIPKLRHVHHAWPHYVHAPDGTRQLYLLVHGWNEGKYAVLKQEPGLVDEAARAA